MLWYLCCKLVWVGVGVYVWEAFRICDTRSHLYDRLSLVPVFCIYNVVHGGRSTLFLYILGIQGIECPYILVPRLSLLEWVLVVLECVSLWAVVCLLGVGYWLVWVLAWASALPLDVGSVRGKAIQFHRAGVSVWRWVRGVV